MKRFKLSIPYLVCTCGHLAHPASTSGPLSQVYEPGGYGVQPWEWRCKGCRMIVAVPEQHHCLLRESLRNR